MCPFTQRGMGFLERRHFYSKASETISSPAYTRHSGFWSECITGTTSGNLVVIDSYHVDNFHSKKDIIRKYLKKIPMFFAKTTEIFYFEMDELDTDFSEMSVEEMTFERVIVPRGTL